MNHDPRIQSAFERMKSDAYQVDAGPAFRAITQGGRQRREWGWVPVFAAVLLVPVVVASFGWYSDRGSPAAQGEPLVSTTSTTIGTPVPSEFDDAVFPPLYLTYLNQVRLLQNWRRSCFLEMGWDGPEPTSGFGMRIRSIEEAEFRGFRGLYIPLKNGDPSTLHPGSDSSVASLEAACDEVIGRVIGATAAGDEGFLDQAQKLSDVIVSDEAVAHAEAAFLVCMADLGFDLPIEEGWAGAPLLVLEQLTYDSQVAVIAGRTPQEYLWNPDMQIRLGEFLGEDAFDLGMAYEESVAGAEAECFADFLPILNRRMFELFEIALYKYRASVESANWVSTFDTQNLWSGFVVAKCTANAGPDILNQLPFGFVPGELDERPSLALIDSNVAATWGYSFFLERPEGWELEETGRLEVVGCNQTQAEGGWVRGFEMLVTAALADQDVVESIRLVEACMAEAGFGEFNRLYSGLQIVFNWMIENVPGPTPGSVTGQYPPETKYIPPEVLEAGRVFEVSVATAEVECVGPFVDAFNASEAATEAWRIAP